MDLSLGDVVELFGSNGALRRLLPAACVCISVIAAVLAAPTRSFAATYASFDGPVAVSDGTGSAPYTPGVGSPFPSTTVVNGLSGVVSKVTVSLISVSHANVDDLNVLLVSPSGRGIQLMSDAGGENAMPGSGSLLAFDDAAPAAIPDFGPAPFTGSYKPSNYFGGLGEDSLFASTGGTGDLYPSPAPAASDWAPYSTLADAFNGTDPNGSWSLYVTDDSPLGGTGGITTYWGMDIETVPAGGGPPIPSPQASFTVAKPSSGAGRRITFDASASLAGGAVASNFKWDMNSDGAADAQCPGSDPIMTTRFNSSRTINATLTVAGADNSMSVARQSVSVVGIRGRASSSRSVRAASFRTDLTRQTFVCNPPPGQSPPDITDNGGPPSGCATSVQFDLIDAVGCLDGVETVDQIPSPERNVLQNYLVSYQQGSRQTARISAGRFNAVQGVLTKQNRDILVAQGPVRVNGVDFYPAPGASIVLLSSFATGNLSRDATPALLVSSNARMQIGGVVLKSGQIRQPFGYGGLKETVHVGDFDLRRDTKLTDLPVNGRVGLDFGRFIAKLPVNLELPPLFSDAAGGKITGSVTLSVDNANGLRLDGVHLNVPHASIGGLGVDDLDFTYARETSLWDAMATVSFPPGGSLSGHVIIEQGALKYVFVKATPPDPGIHTGPGVFLTHIDFTYDGRSGNAFGGAIGVTAGPKVQTPYGQCSLVGVDGQFLLTIGNPVSYRADGDVRLLCLHLVHGYYLVNTDGYFEIGGEATLKFADDFEVSANLKAAAQFTFDHSQIDADLNVCAKIWIADGCVGAEVVASDRGIGVCADFGFTHAGGGVVFPTKLVMFADTCDISRFRSLNKPRASAAGGGQTFRWGAGKPSGLVAVTGAGHPPAVTVTGPHGRRIDATQTVKTANYVVIQRALDNTTYVFVREPAAGSWSVVPSSAADTIARVQVADGLPKPVVSVKVSGSGAHRVLTYSVKPIAGQKVSFSATGAGSVQQLGRARGSHGRIRFVPVPGRSGQRAIVATVIQGSLPRTSLKVARFRATQTRLAPPKGLSAHRAGSRLRVSWRGVAGANHYAVLFMLADGRRQMITTTRKSVGTDSLPPSARGSVTVRAIPRNGRPGSTGRVRVGAVKQPRIRA